MPGIDEPDGTNGDEAGAALEGSVNFQLDGGNNTAGLRGTGNAAPNPEAVQEFRRVVTNSYAAEYGRYQAGVIDVVTKSGTNEFHGAVYEYFRDESPNANRWAPPGVTAEKDPLDRHQFGAAFGGRSSRTRPSSSRATRACGRRARTTATRRSCPPPWSGRATSRSRRSSPRTP